MITELLNISSKFSKQNFIRERGIKSEFVCLGMLLNSILGRNTYLAEFIFAYIDCVKLLAIKNTACPEPLGIQVKQTLTLLSMSFKTLVILISRDLHHWLGRSFKSF